MITSQSPLWEPRLLKNKNLNNYDTHDDVIWKAIEFCIFMAIKNDLRLLMNRKCYADK